MAKCGPRCRLLKWHDDECPNYAIECSNIYTKAFFFLISCWPARMAGKLWNKDYFDLCFAPKKDVPRVTKLSSDTDWFGSIYLVRRTMSFLAQSHSKSLYIISYRYSMDQLKVARLIRIRALHTEPEWVNLRQQIIFAQVTLGAVVLGWYMTIKEILRYVVYEIIKGDSAYKTLKSVQIYAW